MAVHILGDHDCVRFGHIKIWADRGLIHTEDDRDGAYDTISVRTSLERMVALQEMLKNSREDLKRSGGMTGQVYDNIQKMLEDMIDVCRKAQKQGMPDDPRAKHWLKAARPTTIVVPSNASAF